MKHLTSVLAILSLFAAAPVLASDVSSDRHFAETKSAQAEARIAMPDAKADRSPTVTKESCAARCTCAKSVEREAVRSEVGGH